MALYLGEDKVKINLGGQLYYLNLITTTSHIDRISLLSLDNYILQDSTGVYLVPKIDIYGTMLTTIDDYILQDVNGLYLTIEEDE